MYKRRKAQKKKNLKKKKPEKRELTFHIALMISTDVAGRNTLAAWRPDRSLVLPARRRLRAEAEHMVSCAHRWHGHGTEHLRQCREEASRCPQHEAHTICAAAVHRWAGVGLAVR